MQRNLLLLSVMFFTHFTGAQPSEYRKELKKAKQLKEDGLYDSSANAFQGLTVFFPQLSMEHRISTLNGWGLSLLNAARFEQADSVLEEAIKLNRISSQQDSLLLADSYFYLSKNSGSSHRFDLSVEQVSVAMDIWETIGDQDSLIACGHNMLGYDFRHKGDYPGALEAYRKARDIWTTVPKLTGAETANTYAGFGWVYTAMGDYLLAIEEHLKALEIREALFDEGHPYIANSEILLGGVYLRLARYDKAEFFYQRAFEKLRKRLGETHPNVISMYSRLGTIYYQLGDFERSIEFHNQAIRTWHLERKLSSLYLVQFYGELAKSMNANGNLEGALDNLDNAFDYAEGYGRTLYLFALLQVKAQILEQLDRYDEWLKVIQETEQLLQQKLDDHHPALTTIETEYARYYFKTGNLLKSEEIVLDALRQNLRTRGKKHPSLHHQYLLLGDIKKASGDELEALDYYGKSLWCISETADDSSLTLPDPDDVSNLRLGIRALQKMGGSLLDMAGTDHNTSSLHRSLSCFEKGLDYLNVLRDQFSGEEAKSRILELSQPVFWGAVDACHALYNETDSMHYLSRAFGIVEKSKAYNLVNAINNHRAQTFAGVPGEITEEEIYIKTALNYVTNRLRTERVQKDPELAARVEQQRFNLTEKKDSLYRIIAKNYPKYFQFQHESAVLKVSDVQNGLGEKQTVLAYFLTPEKTHIFTLSPHKVQWHVRENPESMASVVANFRRSTSDHTFLVNAPKESDSTFMASGQFLYHHLLLGPLSTVPEGNEIIIIPDDITWQIQFGVLPAESMDIPRVDYRTYPYLIRKFTISYAYAAHFLQATDHKETGSGLLAFAPTYDEMDLSDGFDFGNLPGAGDEVRLIERIVPETVVVTGPQAHKQAFIERSGDYRILHLAMHGQIDNEQPMNSRLIFSQNGQRSGDLYLPEIYGLRLKADLVVLSACESGIGKVQRGEGNQSISRAFNYAGVPSVIMSMWKIPDEITAELMQHFYRNLTSGLGRTEALAKAQLDYLDQQDDPLFSHPYYWSAFILTGHGDPVHFGTSNYWILISAMIAVLLGLVIMRIRKRST